MILKDIWIWILWGGMWRICMHAGTTQNVGLLVTDIIFAFFMCAIWCPPFPYDQRNK